MIEPYTAVALSPRVSACESREDYVRNIRHINAFIDVAYGMAATDGPPVKLIVLPEGAFQSLLVGFKLARDSSRPEVKSTQSPSLNQSNQRLPK